MQWRFKGINGFEFYFFLNPHCMAYCTSATQCTFCDSLSHGMHKPPGGHPGTKMHGWTYFSERRQAGGKRNKKKIPLCISSCDLAWHAYGRPCACLQSGLLSQWAGIRFRDLCVYSATWTLPCPPSCPFAWLSQNPTKTTWNGTFPISNTMKV